MQVNSKKRENTQTTILALLLAHKGGCTLRQLDRDYNELEGEYIPWKELGYVSLLNFLHSMSKTVRLESRNNITMVKGIASDKSKHVSKLVAGQKDYKPPIGRKVHKPSHYYPKTGPVRIHISAEILTRIVSLIDNHPDGLHKDCVLAEVQSRMPFVNITMKDMEEQLQELSHQIFQRNNKFYSVHCKDINSDRLTKSDGKSGSEFDSCKNQNWKASIMTVAGEEDANDMLNYDKEDSFEFLPHSNISMSLDEQLNTRTKSTSSFIKETVSKCQDEPLESTLMAQMNQNGSRSLLSSNCNARNQIAMEFNNNVKVGEENYLETEDVEILINKRVKFRLEKLIQNNPDGIWCADLPEKYLEEYKVPLNYTELGFNSVREFAAQLPHIFHCIQPHDTGDFKLYYAKEGIPANRLEQKKKSVNLTQMYHIYEANNEEALPAAVSLNTCIELIPDDAMTIGECVGNLNVEDFILGDEPYVEVLVVEVFTPSFFWVQFRRKEKLFNKFMDDLHNFYTVKHQQYVIPPVVLEKGLNCACIYNGIWHRGIVKTVKPDFHVTVMFYDYGTLKTYPPEAVFYLHRIFSCLPAQAIPCGLVNVRPCNGSKWSRSATHHFAVRTSQVPLIATIASVNAEDNSMIISLTDTVEEEDVHINDWLVEQKLAEHGRMVCMKKRNFPFHYYLECRDRFQHKFEILGTDKFERNLKHEAALYNVNSAVGLSYKNISNKAHCGKINPCNKDSENLQLLKSNDLRENDILMDDTRNSTRNYNGNAPRKLLSLYEKLLNLKQKSTQPVKSIDIKNNNNINTSSVNEKVDFISESTRSTKQKLYEDTDLLCPDIKRDTSDELTLVNYENNNNLSDGDYDILERHNNIPKQYANHFDIQDPENELDISYMRTFVNKCNEDLIEDADSSEIWKTLTRIKESISERNEFKIPHDTIFKSRDNMSLAENCFSAAACNSSYHTDRDEEICWAPTGNINKIYDGSPLILKDIEKHMRSMANDMTIAIPQETLEMLTEEKYFEERSDIVNSINETQCVSPLHKVSTAEVDNLEDNKDDIFLNKNFDDYSTDCNETDYFSMKTLRSRTKLLEKLLSIKNTSSNTSDLDSDDISTSEGSVLDLYNDSGEGKTEEKYKDNVNVCGDKSNGPCTGTDSECSSHSVQLDTIGLYAREVDEISNHDLCETEITATSPIVPVLTKNSELEEITEAILTDSILTQQLMGQSDSAKNSNNAEEQLLLNGLPLNQEIEEPLDTLMAESLLSVGETMHSQIVPFKESISCKTIANRDYVPVFNDNDINSDDEEWDAQVSHADLFNFHKGISSVNKNIEHRNDLDSRSNIVEIDTNSLAVANDMEIYESANDDTNEFMPSGRIPDRYSYSDSNESNNLSNRHESPETEVSPTNSRKSLEIDNEYISNAINTTPLSYKLQGKAKTLVEMLNKVKLL